MEEHRGSRIRLPIVLPFGRHPQESVLDAQYAPAQPHFMTTNAKQFALNLRASIAKSACVIFFGDGASSLRRSIQAFATWKDF